MANQAQRAQAEYPGAAVVARPSNGILLDTGNGHTVAVIGLKPDYHLPDGTEIDTAWVAESVDGFQWGMTTAGYHARARSVLNAGDLVRFTHPQTGHWVIFDPQSINWVNQDNSRQQIAIKAAVNAVAGTGVDDDLLRWPNGYGTGRHFSYRCVPERLEKLITIDAAANLPNPTVTGTVWFEAEFALKHSDGLTIWLDGVQWPEANNVRVKMSNRIEFKDAGGNVLFGLAKPFARDANGDTSGGEYEVRRQSQTYFCTVRIPRTWLQAAAYPVHIDPTLDLQPNATAGIDTYIQENTATTNFGTNPQIQVMRSMPGQYRHALIRFDLTSIGAGATCNAATLYLTTVDTLNRSHGIFILSVTDWTEGGATWNTKDGTNAWPGSGGASTAGTDYEADASPPTIGGALADTTYSASLTGGANMTAAKIASFFGGYLNLIIGNYGTNATQGWHSSDASTAGYRPRIVIDYSAAVTGAAAVTATATATAAGGVQRPGAAAVTASATTAGAGVLTLGAAAAISAAATTAGAGSMTRGGAGSVSATATTAGAAGVIRGAAAAISGIATAIGAAIRALAGAAGITGRATATATGTVAGPVVQPGHVTMTTTLNATVTMTITGAGT